MSNQCQCPLCYTDAYSQLLRDYQHTLYDCPFCGKFILNNDYVLTNLKNLISQYLFHNKKTNTLIYFFGKDSFAETLKHEDSECYIESVSIESLQSLQSLSFSEKMDQLLLYLAKESDYIGDLKNISETCFLNAAYIPLFDKEGNNFSSTDINNQITILLKYLKDEMKWLDTGHYALRNVQIKISPKGWQAIDELQRKTSFGKKVFIAMSYAKGTEDTREALKKGISESGYYPVLIDEITHNHQIVPEMFKQIRDSKFLVIDTSVPNNGAYYEAGYALGLGKEVIFCCKKETFDDPEKRPHFDVSQKQMIVWNDVNDLQTKLKKWINSLFD